MKKKNLSKGARLAKKQAKARKALGRAVALAQFKKSWRFERAKKDIQNLSGERLNQAMEATLATMAMKGNHNAMEALVQSWDNSPSRTIHDDNGLAETYDLRYASSIVLNDFDTRLADFRYFGNDPKFKFDPTPNAPHKGQS